MIKVKFSASEILSFSC